MRRPLEELAVGTISAYRSRTRKLYLKIQAGVATDADRRELAELEMLLGVPGSEIPGPGRPRKWTGR